MSFGESGSVPGRFDLLASGVAGRALRVAPAVQDEAPWTDGRVIFIDPAAAAPDRIVALAVQASLIAGGSLEPGIVRVLSRRSPALIRRYLAVEAHRALAANSDLLPDRVRGLIEPDLAVLSASPEISLAVASSRDPVPDPLPEFGTIHPKRLLAVAEKVSVSDAPVPPHAEPDAAGQDSIDEDDESFGKLPTLFTNIVGGQGLLGRLLQRMLKVGRESEGGFTGGGVPRSARAVAKPGHIALASLGTPGAIETMAEMRREGVTYPEWDVHRHRYRPDWCTVVESDPRPVADRIAPAMVSSSLHRSLARLRLSLSRQRRRMQGDDLDIDAVVEERVQLLTGSSPDGAVYIESFRRKPDLAILILLDISGSAALPSISGGSVHDQQCAAALELTAALHGLGNQVALYGFFSQGRSSIRMLRVKRFDDPLDAAAMRRLSALKPGAYTRLGAAIRHGSATLEQYSASARTLLVVLSDGLAYDYSYEGVYAEADARRALSEARRQGTGCVCLSVGADADITALHRVFGTASHTGVARPGDLVHVVGPLFRDGLRSADLRRRTHQRTARTRRRSETSRRTA